MKRRVGALVLAAGKGTRMFSERPKVLKTLLGQPMLAYVHQALAPLFGDRVLTVVGHGAEEVRRAFPESEGRFALQAEQRGTGHALATALPALVEAGIEDCLIINGDTPLVRTETLSGFLETVRETFDLAFLSITLPDPGAYGRVVRDQSGRLAGIVEAKDYDPDRYGPPSGEINTGVYFCRLSAVTRLISGLRDDNKSGEYYLTDLVGLGLAAGIKVAAVNRGQDPDLLGVNSPLELVAAEESLRATIVAGHLARGVLIRSGATTRIGPLVEIAPGAEISGPCEIYGRTRIEAEARVGANVFIRDAVIGRGAEVLPFSHLEGAELGALAKAGPFARLRPGARLGQDARVGNFVEVKNSLLRAGVKAGHLSYLGDADIGAGTNIGAGTITCNYDGVRKHKTVIGQGAFIGSNTALVAPVTVGSGALVGAGSVITADVPENMLAVGRGRQKNLPRRKKPA